MKNQLYIPACKKFLEDENGIMDVQRLFSLSRQAYNLKYPNEFPDNQDLLSFLKVNKLVPPAYPLDALNTEHVELCFSMITQNNCNALCQLCGYSPLYKNQYEEQESILLGYALGNWNNLQSLIQTGLTARHFRAMISVSERSKVAVVPLNRLAFEYMEKIPKSQSDMKNLPGQIMDAIKANNKNKLSITDTKIALRYLENLQKGKYQYVDTQIIRDIIKNVYHLEFKEIAGEIEKPSETPVYISGFLGTPTPDKTPVRNIPQENADKKTVVEETSEDSLLQDAKEILEIKKSEDESETMKTPAKRQPSEKVRKIVEWSISRKDFPQGLYTDLEHVTAPQYTMFLEQLLLSPLLPMEIGSLDKEPVIFIYMNKKLYSFSVYNPIIIDDMIPYITKSRFRKIICYEPYHLYSYLYEQQVQPATLFSIKIYADCFAEYKKDNKHPKNLIKKMLEKENNTAVNALYYAMSNYNELYQFAYDKKKIPEEYYRNMFLCQALGFSYNLKTICENCQQLFSEETNDGYKFIYAPGQLLTAPFEPIQFTFAWNDTIEFPVTKLIGKLAENNFYNKYRVYLLSYKKNTVIFAMNKSDKNSLCEIVNNLSCFIAEEMKKTPISVAVSSPKC